MFGRICLLWMHTSIVKEVHLQQQQATLPSDATLTERVFAQSICKLLAALLQTALDKPTGRPGNRSRKS